MLNPWLRPLIAAGISAMTSCVLAQSLTPFVVRDIRVEGIQRTEAGTIFSYLPVKVGEEMTEARAQDALRALFRTGFFKDVRLEADGGTLVIRVEERPAIAQVELSGIKEFQEDAIRKVLREQGLAEGRIFDQSILDAAEQELKRQYLSKSLYAADVRTKITPLERNRVGIALTVSEGDVAKIRRINIIGAKAFPEDELLDQFVLTTPGWLTWYTRFDQYSSQRLAGDLETLRSYYQNRGYLDFAVDSTQVSITPDRSGIFITINITEGERYTISSVELAGQFLLPREELQKLVTVKAGDVFSRLRLTETSKAVTDRLGNDGYAFANANAIPQVDRDKRTVAFTILIDPGRRVYVRRINVAGNNKTRDEVIRRELRQLEGAYYDISKIQLSRRRIDRTQFFSDVTVDTQAVEGAADQVDVNVSVKERPTGSVMVGLGYSTTERLIVTSSISQANLFGSGKSLTASVNSGRINQVYSLSYTDPYYTVDGVSRGFDVYRRDVNATTLAIGSYKTTNTGGGVRYGIPVSEQSAFNFGLSGEHVQLTTFSTSPLNYLRFADEFGSRYTYGTATAGAAYDTRDSLLATTSGTLLRAGTELASGDVEFYRLSAVAQYFLPLSRSYTLQLGTEFGYAAGLGGRTLPFFKNYYVGGPGSVRGYQPYSLGPRAETGEVLGGNRKLLLNTEVLFPVPGAGQDKSLRLAWFIDGGQVYAADQVLKLADLRFAAGLALSWTSPVGPLRFSYATPLNNKPNDRIERVQFTFGTVF